MLFHIKDNEGAEPEAEPSASAEPEGEPENQG